MMTERNAILCWELFTTEQAALDFIAWAALEPDENQVVEVSQAELVKALGKLRSVPLVGVDTGTSGQVLHKRMAFLAGLQ